MTWVLYEGDCLEIMPTLSDKSIDMILCDLPYGTTACAWDSVIPFAPLWEQYERLIKPDGAIVLTASQPFTTALIASNLSLFRYVWYWHKPYTVGFMNANKMPLRNIEEIAVFYKALPKYNPQGVIRINKKQFRRKDKASTVYGDMGISDGEYTQEYSNYPTQLISIGRKGKTEHPTQKPVALFEYLILTYTDPGDTVMDNCAGSGTTGVAAENLGRNSILIEKDPKYCEIIRKRMANRQTTLFEAGVTV